MKEFVVGLSTPLNIITAVDPLKYSILFFLVLVVLFACLLATGLSSLSPQRVRGALPSRVSLREVYRVAIAPMRWWVGLTIAVLVLDAISMALPRPAWLRWAEFPIGIAIAIDVCVLTFQIFDRLFDSYLLEAALSERTKINSELLVLGKYLTRATTVLVVIFFFAQNHQIDLIGLVASVGVAGAALALASQRVLEQILWSIVLVADEPFAVDDYIHLSDRTLGRVESIGWRSTKVRLSGRNTLAIIPNSYLAQDRIENLSRAQRVISMIGLTFHGLLSDEEKAAVHSTILDSTADILGIDRDLTQVTFSDKIYEGNRLQTQGQVVFFILGAAETSMELRRGLLEIARENTLASLQNSGVSCRCDYSTVDVAQPMNI